MTNLNSKEICEYFERILQMTYPNHIEIYPGTTKGTTGTDWSKLNSESEYGYAYISQTSGLWYIEAKGRIPPIKKVIFNPPATIVIWCDGKKTVVKAHGEEFDVEKGLAMCIAERYFGNYSRFKKVIEENSKMTEYSWTKEVKHGYEATEEIKEIARRNNKLREDIRNSRAGGRNNS